MKKSLLFLLVIPFLFLSCVTTTAVRVTQAIIAGDPTTPKEEREFKLNIIFTNDVHGHVDREGKMDGVTDMATVAGFVDIVRENNQNVLLLDAGDFISGTLFSDSYRGASMEELAGMMGYNAMAVGNQDFMFGYRVLVSNMEDARRRNNFYVAQNIKNGGRTITDRYKIFNFNGFKIGVIGLTTPETKMRAFPDSISGLRFDIDTRELQRDINSLSRVVDYIILLSHVGQYEEEDKFISIRTILKSIEGVDLVIDGHSHTVVEEPDNVNNALIVQAGSYLNNIGMVELEIEHGEVVGTQYNLISADELNDPASSDYMKAFGVVSKPFSEKVSNFIASKKKSIKHQFGDYGYFETGDVVANTSYQLMGGEVLMRTQQTDLGYVVAEGYREACDADFAIVNAGSIRSGLPMGNVTADDLYAFCPYSWPVVRVSLTGKEVWDIFQYAASALPSADGRYPQTDLHIEISPNLPIGSKVTAIYFRDGKTDVVNSPNVIYSVAINDYMLAGGDGYDIPRNGIHKVKPMKDIVFGHISDVYPSI